MKHVIPAPPRTRWHMHYGEYNPEIKVRVISERLAYLNYTKNQMNNTDHTKVVILTWWDTFWHNKTLEQKIEEESRKLSAWIRTYNEGVVSRKIKSEQLTERVNKHD